MLNSYDVKRGALLRMDDLAFVWTFNSHKVHSVWRTKKKTPNSGLFRYPSKHLNNLINRKNFKSNFVEHKRTFHIIINCVFRPCCDHYKIPFVNAFIESQYHIQYHINTCICIRMFIIIIFIFNQSNAVYSVQQSVPQTIINAMIRFSKEIWLNLFAITSY